MNLRECKAACLKPTKQSVTIGSRPLKSEEGRSVPYSVRMDGIDAFEGKGEYKLVQGLILGLFLWGLRQMIARVTPNQWHDVASWQKYSQ